ncbi:FMN-binding protein [Clostridium hydrogenum]|uniref:FMN-binding protein n=1 Tax=Clostridium hydrogenum TaxID=2855764 RepID=UPI001F1F900E|nr:FMN-binding protein [Clostridium hydrogenum]
MGIGKKVCLVLVSLCIVVGIFFGVNYLLNYEKYENAIKKISIRNVDLSKVSDGTYKGSYDAVMVAADVSATVRNHKITDIKILRHKNERGQRAEVIPQRVLAAQSLKVDTVSGATNSSKVILKAIENALESKK